MAAHQGDTFLASEVVSGQQGGGDARRTGTILRWTVAVCLVLMLSGALTLLGIFLFRPDLGEELTVGLNPGQYYSDFNADSMILTDEEYKSVYAVAHNSGDDLNVVLESLVYGSDVIEMDVVEMDGVLYSAHNPPLPFIGDRWFRGPRVDRVWALAGNARGIQLDLKQTDSRFVNLVVNFITSKPKTRPIFVASRDPSVLREIRERAPHVVLLMSVPDLQSLDDLLASDSLTRLVDGVTIRQSVITEETAARINADGLLMFAWVVNDLNRVNELIELGVDGITSDNLAILNLLGGEVPVDEEEDADGTPAA